MFKFCIENKQLQDACFKLCKLVDNVGGKAIIVGGSVRDAFLNLPARDLDIEVYGISQTTLENLLKSHFKIDSIGKSFGILKLHGFDIDVAVPRRESKTGTGHKGFSVVPDHSMSFEEASKRRDFTINAMGYDLLSGDLLDPHGGSKDLEEGVLKHTSHRFSEDPLRVLRAMQFAARFDLNVAPETVDLCQGLGMESLPKERIFGEWEKLILRGKAPSRGLDFLKTCGWVNHFPPLAALAGCEQDPIWHPEGDVWVHTLHCMDAFAKERTGDDKEDLIVGLAVLCHDFGKPSTTKFEKGKIRAHGHEKAGEVPARAFLESLTHQHDLVDMIVPLVTCHLAPSTLFEAKAGDAAVRRLAQKVGRIDRLVRVARADQQGRPPKLFDGFPAGNWLLERAAALAVTRSAPEPLIQGRHLIEKLRLEPGPHFKSILDKCFEAQLAGEFSTLQGGIEYASRYKFSYNAIPDGTNQNLVDFP